LELGLELLHSLRCNDKRQAINTSSITNAAALESNYHGKQATNKQTNNTRIK
ncbi:MAG: hypothetical protein JJV99_11740, partial [Colwellia sp.]|nr:hypothetical protein [Colwellia sp.]